MSGRKPRPPRHELLHPPKPLTQWAAELDLPYGTLHRWRREAGANCSTRGADHWNAKLSAEDVALIRELLKTDLQQKDIAAKFEVSAATISDIKRGDSW